MRDFSRQFGGYDGLFQAVETYQAIKALLTDFGKDETHFLHSVEFLRNLVNDLANPPAQPKVSKRLGVRRRGRPTREEVDPTQPTLEDVIAQVLDHSKEGLTISEIEVRVRNTGYKSMSRNFYNRVQHAVGRLVKKKVLVRDSESQRYFKKEAA